MIEERHWISLEGQKLALVLHLPGPGRWPCVVACHGLGASKDSEKYLLLGRELPSAGFALCRFDFLKPHEMISSGVSLLGSSLGGFVALHSAAREPTGGCVITWNSPATLRGLTRDAGGDVAGLGPAFFEELDRGTLVDAPNGVARVLMVQGERDEVVPPAHARLLRNAAREPKRLHLIPGADHRLTDLTHRMEALRESLTWLRRHHN